MSLSPPSPPPPISDQTTSMIRPLSLEERENILREKPSRAVHDLVFERHIDLFDRLEIGAPPPIFEKALSPARITFWNVERGRCPEAQASLLRRQTAAAHLLCELDLGMARTGQRHTTRDLAHALDASYAFGVEFLELGLGNRQEQSELGGQANAAGLHGAAILSPHLLGRPAVIRLDRHGDWFDGERGERRVGGRIAILATLTIDDKPVTLASVHLESHGDRAGRLEQTHCLLDAIDAYAPAQPALIGGNFNCSTMDQRWTSDVLLTIDRVMDPTPHEPMFNLLADRGFDWRSANDMTRPTQRWSFGQHEDRPKGKIDWFFARDLDLQQAKTLPAIDAAGHDLSDHELLTVEITPKTE